MKASRQKNPKSRLPSLFLALGIGNDLPWWWEQVKADKSLCEIDYRRFTVRNKRSKEITTCDLPWLFLNVLLVLLKSAARYEYVFTVENDFNSFAVSFWQTVLFMRKPKHVIISFIMREKTQRLPSRLKFAVMRFLFFSVHKAVCSARMEVNYYQNVFQWPHGKAVFVPILTAREHLDHATEDTDGFIFAGGRVYRDYHTLAEALANTPYRAVVVADREVPVLQDHPNIKPLFRIPLEDFNSLLSRSRIVIVPLEDKPFSIGQTVILQAMALGKPVIATKTAATVDYIDHLESGMLVKPNDPIGLRKAIDQLMCDEQLRVRLATNGKDRVLHGHLPHHYSRNIRRALLENRDRSGNGQDT